LSRGNFDDKIKKILMKKNLLLLYENFHKKTKSQKRIIGKKNFTYRNLIEVLGKYIDDEKEILDIGCGAGTVDFYLAKVGHKILGIDISGKAVEACRESSQALGLEYRLNFEKLNFPKEKPSGKFDLVICSEVLEHLKNDQKAVKVIFGLLRPGGVAIISTPSKNAPLYRIGFAKEFDKEVGHLRRYSLKELKILVGKTGFVVLETIKTEGILRNFLFLNPIADKLVRVLNKIGALSDIITFMDRLTIPVFGESDIFITAQKP